MKHIGYEIYLPETQDRGSEIFNALKDLFYKVVQHTHDGVNSPSIDTKSLFSNEIQVDKSNWVAVSGGYEQSITLPTGRTLENSVLRFFIADGPDIHKQVYPTINPDSLNVFKVKINTNQIGLKLVY